MCLRVRCDVPVRLWHSLDEHKKKMHEHQEEFPQPALSALQHRLAFFLINKLQDEYTSAKVYFLLKLKEKYKRSTGNIMIN